MADDDITNSDAAKLERLLAMRNKAYSVLQEQPDHPKAAALHELLDAARGVLPTTDPRPPKQPYVDRTGGLRGDPNEGGVAQRLDAPAPMFDPLGEGRRLQRRMRAGSTPEAAQQLERETADPLSSGRPDPITMQALAGPAASVVGASVRALPIVRSLLQGGALARGAGGAVVGGAEGYTANVATGGHARPRELSDILPIILGALGRSSGEAAKAIRDPLTRTGRQTAAVEAAGGRANPNPFGRSATGGIYDTPEYRGLPEGDAGTLQMADHMRDRIDSGVRGRLDQAGSDLAAAEAPLSGRTVDTTPAVRRLDDMAQEFRGRQSEPLSPVALDQIESARGRLHQSAGDAFTPPRAQISFDDLRTLVKELQDAGKFGADPTRRNSAGKRIVGAASDLQRGLSPDLDAALENYGTQAEAARGANSALYGRPSSGLPAARLQDTPARRVAATSRLADVGKETKTGLNRTTRLEEELGQTYGPELAAMNARNAAESLRFGMPNGGRPLATAIRAIPHNLDALQVRLAEPFGRAATKATQPMLLPLEALMLRRKFGPKDEENQQ